MTRCRASAESLLLPAVLLSLAAPVSAAGEAGAGSALFAQQCSGCHAGGAVTLRTAPDALAALLRSGQVRKHRFALSDGQLADLAAYLTEVKADGR